MNGLLRLTDEQKRFYDENGYLIGLLPVFDEQEVHDLNEGLQELSKFLRPGETQLVINSWERSSRWLYDITSHPQILNYVEDILGPNFYMWGTHFFSKPPHSSVTVSWHQDAYYWPLSPHHTVTVWLAFFDSDAENGAMQVIPKTHKAGMLKHRTKTDPTNALGLELEKGTFREKDAVLLNLKAGEVSLHDDAIVHGSSANHSDRWRIGLTIRYSKTDVKCDLSKWPEFRAYQMRGTDEFNLNPKGTIPTEKFGRYDHRSTKK